VERSRVNLLIPGPTPLPPEVREAMASWRARLAGPSAGAADQTLRLWSLAPAASDAAVWPLRFQR